MFLCISSDCFLKTGSKSEDAHTSSQPILPYSHTGHNYTGHGLPRGQRKNQKKHRFKTKSECKQYLSPGINISYRAERWAGYIAERVAKNWCDRKRWDGVNY